jgi:hypothetical protein
MRLRCAKKAPVNIAAAGHTRHVPNPTMTVRRATRLLAVPYAFRAGHREHRHFPRFPVEEQFFSIHHGLFDASLSCGVRFALLGRRKRRRGAKMASNPSVITEAFGPRLWGLVRGARATAQSLESLELVSVVSVVPPLPLLPLLPPLPPVSPLQSMPSELELVSVVGSVVLPLQSSEDEVSLLDVSVLDVSVVLPLQSSEDEVSLLDVSVVLPLQSSEDEVS